MDPMVTKAIVGMTSLAFFVGAHFLPGNSEILTAVATFLIGVVMPEAGKRVAKSPFKGE